MAVTDSRPSGVVNSRNALNARNERYRTEGKPDYGSGSQGALNRAYGNSKDELRKRETRIPGVIVDSRTAQRTHLAEARKRARVENRTAARKDARERRRQKADQLDELDQGNALAQQHIQDNTLAGQQYLNPYAQIGGQANDMFANLMGLNGELAQQQAYDSYGPMAGYNEDIDARVNEETLRAMNATGGANSGRAWLALQRAGQERHDQRFNQYLDRLQGSTASGQNASNALANSQWNQGTQLANLSNELGSNRAKVIGDVEGTIANNALGLSNAITGIDMTTARDLADTNQWGANSRLNMEYWAGNQTLDLERWLAEQQIALNQSQGGGMGGAGQALGAVGSILGMI